MSRPISDLLATHAAGDDSAASEIYAHFYGLARAVARQRINRLIQARVSPSEVANMGLKSALSEMANRGTPAIRSGEFKALLVAIVRKKVTSLYRREMAEQRTPLREQRQPDVLTEYASRAPGPEQQAIAKETMTRLTDLILSGPDDTDRAIGYLRFFEGYSTQQICDWLQNQGGKALKPRAVELRIKRIRKRVEEAFLLEVT